MANWFNNIKLQKKFIIIITIAIVIIVSVEIRGRRIAYTAYDEQLYIKTVQVLTTYADHIEIEFDKMENLTLSIIGDTSVQNNLMTIRDGTVGSNDWLEARNEIAYCISSYLFNNDYFQDFSVVTSNTVIHNNAYDLPADKFHSYESKAIAANGRMLLLPEEQGLTFIREIRQIKFMKLSTLGIIVARINFSALIEDCGKSFEKAGVTPDITVFQDDICIYSPGSEENSLSHDEDGWKIENGKFVVIYTAPDINMTFAVSMPYDEIYSSIKAADVKSVMLSIMVAVLTIAASAFIVASVTKGLTVLVKKIDDFKHGNLPKEKDSAQYSDRKDEIGRLHRHFDRMATDYRTLTEENFNSMLLLKESQFSQLQQQIQPHFLFNTLSNISWMAYANQDEKVAHVAESLGRILRSTLEDKENIITLGEDLGIIEDYLYIQKARFGERLSVSIDIPDEILPDKIPRMTVQPIVENAIIHGMEEMIDNCTIRITGRAAGNVTELIVEDNGPGIDENILEKIENGSVKAKGLGIGLKNINSRIQLAFSKEYGLYFSNSSGFTQVIVRIPHNSANS